MKISSVFCLIILTLCGLLFCGLTNTTDIIRDKIEEVFLANIEYIVVSKDDNDQIYTSYLTKEETTTFVKQFERISNLNEYVTNFTVGSGFKDGERYHALILNLKRNNRWKKMFMLYSIEDKTMVVRERDLFPNEKEYASNKERVFEFTVPSKIIEILVKHEKELPKRGWYYSSWPSPY